MGIKALPAKVCFFLGTLLFFTACRHDPFTVDISGIKYDLTIRDLCSEIFDTPPPEMNTKADTLRIKYKKVMRTYSAVTGLGNIDDPKWNSSFVLFATDLHNMALYDDVRKVWPSLQPLEDDLGSAFRHYLYYFPGADIPEVFTCITAFNNSVVVDDSLLMISLDRYLGADSKYYPAMGIYEYQSRKMTPAYAASDCIYAWATTEWDYHYMDYGTKTLLTSMLHEAKLLYFTRCMLPEEPDTIIFGFKKKQLDFCLANESRMWEYYVSHDMLFSTDGFLIRKLTGEAPFTSYFTEDSPGRAAVWTGFRIIERYMRNNPDITLAELMKTTNCQAILTGAKYNPD